MYSCSIVFYIISEYNSILSSYTEVFWSILILWGFRQMQKNWLQLKFKYKTKNIKNIHKSSNSFSSVQK